jgi:hypothetical protein
MVETLVVVVVIFSTVATVQFLIKPQMKKYHDEGWYGLAINVITILLVMFFTVVIMFVEIITTISIIEAGVDFIIKIFGAVFVYEILKNIKTLVASNGNSTKEANNG